MPTSATAQRAPLAELPISLYASQASNLPPSPVSLPIKRGPLSASQKDSESSQMAKRRGSERISVTLEEDELGTGRSPARRLFAQSSPSQPSLAPSPPLSRRSARLSPYTLTERTSNSNHDPGFTILSDDDPRARRPAATILRTFADEESENVSPFGDDLSRMSAPQTPARRAKYFERSKLGTQSVVASPPELSPTDGKEAMKLEAEGV